MDYSEIKKIIQDMGDSKLDTLEIEFPDGLKIKMDKGKSDTETITNVKSVTNNVSQISKPIDDVIKQDEKYDEIKSPMVGTFYSKSSPEAEPFVKVGDKVKKGQVVCIVEAMKLMNEIESDYSGRIKEILVKDGEAVDYGKELFVIEE